MYVQKYLGHFDDFELDHYSPKKTKSAFGPKVNHYSLASLSINLPLEFEKICRLESYALIREPRARFVSSVFQHVRETSKWLFFLNFLVNRKVGNLISSLKLHNSQFLPVELIHFTPQSNYIKFDTYRVIDNLYSTDKAHVLVSRILKDKIGLSELPAGLDQIYHESRGSKLSIDSLARDQQFFVFKTKIYKWLVGLVSRQAARLTTELYDEIERVVSSSTEAQEFISKFYSEDFILHCELTSNDLSG